MSVQSTRPGIRVAGGAITAMLLAAGALSGITQAFNPQPDPPAFGMVGITEGQTARLNLANLSTQSEVSPGPCRATLQFVDADGSLLATRRVTVQAGRATSLDYVAAIRPTGDVAAVGIARAEIRPIVDPLIGGVSPGPCRATVEIFDNATGRTSIFYAPTGHTRIADGRQ